MFLCVILMNIDSDQKKVDGEQIRTYAFIAVGIASLMPVLFTFRHVVVRWYRDKVNIWLTVLHVQFLMYFIFFILLIYLII